MKFKINLGLLAIAFMFITIVSCKKETTTTTTNNTNTINVTGNWNLQLWDGAAATGSLLFTASNFTLNCTTFGIADNGTYTNSGSNYTFTSAGVMGAGNTWVMDSLTSNVLLMHSNMNLIVRATK